MIDLKTGTPLTVSKDARAPAFLFLRQDQVADVSRLLDQHQVRYEVSNYFTSIDGKPATTYIQFGWKVDPKQVQDILDGSN